MNGLPSGVKSWHPIVTGQGKRVNLATGMRIAAGPYGEGFSAGSRFPQPFTEPEPRPITDDVPISRD